jgi:hypothetical protein
LQSSAQEKNCNNCGTALIDSYCHHCGQKAEVQKLNFHYLWHDFQHGILHVDKGILYTLKQLFTRPGHSIREFLQGKRVKHFKPFSMVIILAGTFGFLYHYWHVDVFKAMEKTVMEADANRMVALNNWISKHYALISILSIPIYALGTFLAFRKQGYNFTEHLVINAFLTGQRLFVRILTFPLFLSLNNSEHIEMIKNVYVCTDLFFFIWTFCQLFNTSKYWKTMIQSLLAYIVFFSILILSLFLVDLIYQNFLLAH